MRLTPTTARSLVDGHPVAVARGIAGARVALGAAMLLAPDAFLRPFVRAGARSSEAVTAWRVAGGRDLAMGVATLLSARRSSPALRGWVEASALADLTDLYTFGRDSAFHPLARAGSALSAATVAGVGMWTARRLG